MRIAARQLDPRGVGIRAHPIGRPSRTESDRELRPSADGSRSGPCYSTGSPPLPGAERSMSGHSKWSTIKRKKGAADAKRGKMFTKLIREIADRRAPRRRRPRRESRACAWSSRRPAPSTCPRTTSSVPSRRAPAAATAHFEEIRYEGYGPGGVAILVETLSDNRNRTVGEVRHALSRTAATSARPAASRTCSNARACSSSTAPRSTRTRCSRRRSRPAPSTSSRAKTARGADRPTELRLGADALVGRASPPPPQRSRCAGHHRDARGRERRADAGSWPRRSTSSTTCRRSTRTSTSPTRSWRASRGGCRSRPQSIATSVRASASIGGGMRILGIDPGSVATGCGVVERVAVACAPSRTAPSPAARATLAARLALPAPRAAAVAARKRPTRVVVERVFVAANARSALVLGQARGVVLAASARRGLAVGEYSPRQVKLASRAPAPPRRRRCRRW